MKPRYRVWKDGQQWCVSVSRDGTTNSRPFIRARTLDNAMNRLCKRLRFYSRLTGITA